MESYKYRQILLALREEYKKNEKELQALKKYICLTSDKELQDFYFGISAQGMDKFIELELKHKQSMILKLIESLQNTIVKKSNTITTQISLEYNGEKRYIVRPDSTDYAINDMNSFMADADRVLGNKFTQNITTSKIRVPETKFSIRTVPSGIIADTGDYSAFYTPSRLVYKSVDDSIDLTVYDDPLYLEQADYIFNTEIPAKDLPKFHRDIIDNSKVADKKIGIQGLSLTKVPQTFQLEDTDDMVVLRRVK